jgi:5-oxoprolinase (ATP-hydrolysing)
VTIQAPQLDINTVAAGGGSRLFYRNGMVEVGPESAGAHPGPLCYRKGGHAAVTDANLLLGRVVPAFFPAIFGVGEDAPLDAGAAEAGLRVLADEINDAARRKGQAEKSLDEVRRGGWTDGERKRP